MSSSTRAASRLRLDLRRQRLDPCQARQRQARVCFVFGQRQRRRPARRIQRQRLVPGLRGAGLAALGAGDLA